MTQADLVILEWCSVFFMFLSAFSDQDIDGRKPWLSRHIRIWARRDWWIFAAHVFAAPVVFSLWPLGNAILFYGSAAVLHFYAFCIGYAAGIGEIKSIFHIGAIIEKGQLYQDVPPQWIWRLLQIVPGLFIGYLARVLYDTFF